MEVGIQLKALAYLPSHINSGAYFTWTFRTPEPKWTRRRRWKSVLIFKRNFIYRSIWLRRIRDFPSSVVHACLIQRTVFFLLLCLSFLEDSRFDLSSPCSLGYSVIIEYICVSCSLRVLFLLCSPTSIPYNCQVSHFLQLFRVWVLFFAA
jgi:hypothetical protein